MKISDDKRVLPDIPAYKIEVNKRLGWVDYARGLAIILVLYRHTMVGLRRAGLDVPVFLYEIQEFLLNVRMPVFFILSGVFLGRSLEKKSKKIIASKKASKLLYPYFLWSVFFISIQILLNRYTNSSRTVNDYWYIITQPRELDHMWYLLALFNSSILFLLLYNGLLKNPYVHIILAVGLHILNPFFSDYSLVSDILYHYIFLVAGVFIYKNIGQLECLPVRNLLFALILILPVFIFGQLFWMNNIDEFYQPIKFWYLLPFIIIIFIGCIVYYLVSRIVFQLGKARFLGWIGKYSLYIYILHLFVISMIRILLVQFFHFTNVISIIIICLILGIVIPVWIYKMVEKLKMNYLFSLERMK